MASLSDVEPMMNGSHPMFVGATTERRNSLSVIETDSILPELLTEDEMSERLSV